MRNVRIASGTTQPETRCTPHGRYVPPVIEEGSGHMTSIPRHPKTALLTAALAGVAVIAAGCSSSGGGGSTKTSGRWPASVTLPVAGS